MGRNDGFNFWFATTTSFLDSCPSWADCDARDDLSGCFIGYYCSCHIADHNTFCDHYCDALPTHARVLSQYAILCKGVFTYKVQRPDMAHATEIRLETSKNNLSHVEIYAPVIYTPYSIEKGQSRLAAIRILIDFLEFYIFDF